MDYGSNANGEATLHLTAEEHERFKAGEVIKSRKVCRTGYYDITVQMKFVKPLSKDDRVSEKCNCGEKIKTFMHICDERSDLIEINGCPSCDDRCEKCGI